MRILVLGGGGFLGSSVVEALISMDHHVTIFENPRVIPYRVFSRHERVEWVRGDYLNRHDIFEALKGIDCVIHLISTTLPKTSNDDPVHDVQSNLVATINLLEMMKERGVRKIVFSSSGGTVYGIPERIPINENHPTNPIVSYGIVKLAIEKYLHLYHVLYDIQPVILRISNPYGPRQRVETAQGVIMAFLNRIINKQPVEIWGDGRVVRDYLYISDVGSAFEKAVSYSGKEIVFNIGSGIGVCLNELVNIMGQVMGHKIPCNYLPGRAYDVPISILDRIKAEKELGWVPNTELLEGIDKTLLWLKKTGEQFSYE